MTARFRAPLPFVFRGGTDPSSQDARLERERYERREIRRSGREVAYEDLEPSPTGRVWRRTRATLRPPSTWHADSVGHLRSFVLDHRLREPPRGVTELHLSGDRTPTGLGGPNPPEAEMERELRAMWKYFGQGRERDYRASLRRRPAGGTRSRR